MCMCLISNDDVIFQREAVLEEEKDAYDTLLTQVELQDRVVAINTAVKKEAAEARCNDIGLHYCELMVVVAQGDGSSRWW